MKLMIAIVQDEDAGRLTENLTEAGFGITKLATTGGFLRVGNTTLLLGVEDGKVSDAMRVIESTCKKRSQTVPASPSIAGMQEAYPVFPVEVSVGGATVFVLSVDQFVKL